MQRLQHNFTSITITPGFLRVLHSTHGQVDKSINLDIGLKEHKQDNELRVLIFYMQRFLPCLLYLSSLPQRRGSYMQHKILLEWPQNLA